MPKAECREFNVSDSPESNNHSKWLFDHTHKCIASERNPSRFQEETQINIVEISRILGLKHWDRQGMPVSPNFLLEPWNKNNMIFFGTSKQKYNLFKAKVCTGRITLLLE